MSNRELTRYQLNVLVTRETAIVTGQWADEIGKNIADWLKQISCDLDPNTSSMVRITFYVEPETLG